MIEMKARTARSIADAEEILELGADCPIEPEQVYLKSEADKVIAEKDKAISELKEAQRWRKFPDEKPEEWDTVIVRIGDGFYDLAVYLSNGQGWDIGDGTYHKSEEVTHWMPLPSAPKEEK